MASSVEALKKYRNFNMAGKLSAFISAGDLSPLLCSNLTVARSPDSISNVESATRYRFKTATHMRNILTASGIIGFVAEILVRSFL